MYKREYMRNYMRQYNKIEENRNKALMYMKNYYENKKKEFDKKLKEMDSDYVLKQMERQQKTIHYKNLEIARKLEVPKYDIDFIITNHKDIEFNDITYYQRVYLLKNHRRVYFNIYNKKYWKKIEDQQIEKYTIEFIKDNYLTREIKFKDITKKQRTELRKNCINAYNYLRRYCND